MDARKARLCDIVRETGAKTIHYLYDFGDSWDHVIKLEKWLPPRRACPSCSRPPVVVLRKTSAVRQATAEYLDAISDPAHPEHEHMRRWGPERFDPNVIDRKALEAAVNAMSDIWKPRRRATRTK
ncbi:plasmid pRiA4b ORF-3 family protein [Bradyrhizobium sp. 177]|uniref:plasmid pRiA4b ORF-3 family protein n=1 Tax=Bradyrhizobium sp. 177 TaxID=2782647 RepID=UPI00209744E3|nr:plasmid pRiA4b ORF-3 family protein [Bradyrhizobium sp. 177]